MIAKPMGQIWLWSSIAEMLIEEDGDYFRNFWTKPGYVGFDEPLHVEKDLIDRKLPVSRIITARDLQGEEFAGQEYSDARARARSEEHTSELQSLMRISYAVFCLKKKNPSYLENAC